MAVVEQKHNIDNYCIKTDDELPLLALSGCESTLWPPHPLAQSLLGTYLYVPVEVSEDFPGEKHTKPQNVKVRTVSMLSSHVPWYDGVHFFRICRRCEQGQTKPQKYNILVYLVHVTWHLRCGEGGVL